MEKPRSDRNGPVNERHEEIRLRIYLGEDKRVGDRPLYHAIVAKARQLHLAGAMVVRGTEGFGHSTRLHTADVLFSEDLPVLIEIIDKAPRIDELIAALDHMDNIGLMTYEPVTVLRC